MPLEFKNLSESVIKDSKGVEKGLESVIKTAEKADKAFLKMSASQKSALDISRKFKTAVDSLSKGLSKLNKIGASSFKNFDSISRTSKTSATSVEALGINIKKLAEQLKKQSKLSTNLVKLDKKRYTAVDNLEWKENLRRKTLVKVTKEEKKKVDGNKKTVKAEKDYVHSVDDAAKAGKKQADVAKKSGLDKILKKQIGEARHLLKGLEIKYEDVENAKPVLDLKVNIAKMEEFAELVEWLKEDEKAAIEAKLAHTDLGKVIEEEASCNEDFALRLHKSASALEEVGESADKLHGEIGKASSITDLLGNRLAEGGKEAKNFADGLGISNGALIGAGVATVYLAGKASELIGSFTGSRMSLAKYRQETLLSSKETLGFSKGALENLRKSLSLTREQAKDYFKVVHEGANQLGMAPAAIEAVSKALQNTFGGDPTEKLKEYVDLLKDIPSLDTDLKVTASLDDQSAALFDLAQRGKIETVIDLQSAGILGGSGKGMEFDTNDKAVIQAQQKTESRVQAVNDTMLKYYPDWGPQFSAIADGVFKTFGAIGAGVTILGAMKAFTMANSTKAISGISKVDTSVLAVKASVDALGMKMSVAEKVKTGLPRNSRGQFVSAKDKSAGDFITRVPKGPPPLPKEAIPVTKNFIGGITKATKISFGVGIALEAAGIAADYLSGKLDESGNDIGSAAAKAGSSLLKIGSAAAAGAAIGSIVPVIGTAVGAAAGAVVGLVANFNDLSDSVAKFGKGMERIKTGKKKVGGVEVDEYGATAKALAEATGWVGKGLGHLGIELKDLDLKKAAGFLFDWTTGLGLAIQASKVFDKAMQDPKTKKAYAEAGVSAEKLNKAMKELSDATNDYDKKSEEYIKGVMQSGLELEKEMSRLKKELASGRFAFVDFQAAIAQVDIGVLSDIGGSAQAFGLAVDASAAAVTKRFSMMTDVLADSRKRIMSDAKLQGPQRRQQLDELHKQEMEAARSFVDGMDKVIDALYKSPAIIQAGLKKQIAAVPMDVGLESGGMGVDDFISSFKTQMDELRKKQKSTAEAGEKAEQELAQTRIAAADASKKAIDSLGDEEKKVLTDKGIIKATKDGYDVQADAASAFFQEADKGVKTVGDSLDNLRKKIGDSGGVQGLIVEMAQLNASSLNASASVKKAAQAQKEAAEKGDLAGVKAAQDQLEAAEKMASGVEKAKMNVEIEMDKMAESMSKSLTEGLDIKPADVKKYFKVVAGSFGAGGKITADTVQDKSVDVDSAVKMSANFVKALKKSGTDIEEIKPLMEKYAKAVDTREAARTATDKVDAVTKMDEKRLKIVTEDATVLKEIGELEAKVNKLMETAEVRGAERRLSFLKNLEAEAALMGNPTEQIVASLIQQADLFSKQMDASDKALSIANAQVGVQFKSVAAAEETLKAAKEKVKVGNVEADEGVKDAKKNLAKAKVEYGFAQKAQEDANKARTELEKSIPKIGASIAKALEDFNDSFSGQEIASRLDLGDALMEFSTFGDNFTKDVKEAADIGIKAARDKFEAEKKVIEQTTKAEEEWMEKRVAIANKVGGPAAGKAAKEDAELIIAARKRAQLAGEETKYKRKVVELAEAELSNKTGIIDASQSALDSEMEVASMRGYSLNVMIDKQKEMLGFEKQRVDAIKEAYERESAISSNSVKTQMLGLQLRKAEADLQKKSLGYTRDVMEKMLGVALGGIRSSVGGRKQKGTDIALMGLEGTRVKTRAGMYTGAGSEGDKPYYQRLAEYQSGGKGGAARLSPEKAMAQGLRDSGVEDSTKDTAEAVASLNKHATHKGSLYTHDTRAEKLLASILYVAEEMAVGLLEGNKNAIGGGVGVRDLLDSGIKNVKEMVSKTQDVAENTNDSAAGQKEVAYYTGCTADDGEMSNKMQKKQVVMQKQELAIDKKAIKADKNFQQKVEKGASGPIASKMGGPSGKLGGPSGKLGGPEMKLGGPSGKLGGYTFGKQLGGDKIGLQEGGDSTYKKNLAKQQEDSAKKQEKYTKNETRLKSEGLATVKQEASMTAQDTMAIAQRSRSLSPVGGAAGQAAFAPSGGVRGALGGSGAAAAVGGAGGGGMTQAPTMKVEGNMTVRFDNTAFKDQIARVVGEVIKTPEISKAIQSMGFINTKV